MPLFLNIPFFFGSIITLSLLVYFSSLFPKSKLKWRRRCTGLFPSPLTQPSKTTISFLAQLLLRTNKLWFQFYSLLSSLPGKVALCVIHSPREWILFISQFAFYVKLLKYYVLSSWFGNGRNSKIGNQSVFVCCSSWKFIIHT